MRFQLRNKGSKWQVLDVRTGDVRFEGSLDAARASQSMLIRTQTLLDGIVRRARV